MRDLLCDLSDWVGDLSLTEWLGIATLLLVLVSLWLSIRWHRRAGWADFEAERISAYENPGAPAGWQVTVTVRNKGPARAHNVEVWLAVTDGTRISPRYPAGEMEPGERANVTLEPPRAPSCGAIPWTYDLPTEPLPDAVRVLAEAIERTLPPREDRDAEAPLFPDVSADRLRTAIARACRAVGVPVFSACGWAGMTPASRRSATRAYASRQGVSSAARRAARDSIGGGGSAARGMSGSPTRLENCVYGLHLPPMWRGRYGGGASQTGRDNHALPIAGLFHE